ncbi:response regulator [Phenylobacterium sp.]|jgi:CheY-like chemotaxis protein|uniref:response regulator n=1 Tax=Phenylobacterium sp. TaxID=1871053 RepID=UPI002F93914B
MADTDRRHALIIEDEMLIALEVEHLLREMGFTSFAFADSPAEALSSAKACRPDLITADMRIHGGTGLEAVRSISTELGEVPYVFVTGNASMLQSEPRALVVEKPINRRIFAAACEAAGA